jgi:hypothetical protein
MYSTVFLRPFHTLFLQAKAIIDVNNIKTAPIIRMTTPTNNIIENITIILIRNPSIVSTKISPYTLGIMYEYKVYPSE